MSELRFYSFVNFYLSSIQQGVQSFHVCHEMFNKYQDDPSVPSSHPSDKAYRQLREWSKYHKTLIVLNGGANTDIEDTYYLLEKLSKNLSIPLPFAKFHEDEKSLGGIMTACGCVLPQEIYEATDWRKAAAKLDWSEESLNRNSFHYVDSESNLTSYHEGSAEHELITMIKSCSLAR